MSARVLVCVLVCAAFCVPGMSASDAAAEYTEGWGDPVFLESSNLWDSSEPDVAIDGHGNSVVVWYQLDGVLYSVFANRYEPETGWLGPEALDQNDVNFALSPSVAMNDRGDAVVVWYERVEPTDMTDITMSVYEDGVGWSAPLAVETDHTWNDVTPEVVIDEEGNAIIIWVQMSEPSYIVWASYYEVGVGLGFPHQLNVPVIPEDVEDLAIGMDGDGNAIAAWIEDGGSVTSAWSARFDKEDGWETSQKLGDDARNGPLVLAVAEDGNATCAWSHQNSVPYVKYLYATTYVLGVGWGPRQTVYSDSTYSAWADSVGVDRHGNALLIWDVYTADLTHVKCTPYESGVGWQPSYTIVSAWSLIDTGGAKIAMNADGDALLVFLVLGLTPAGETWGMVYDASEGWGNPEPIGPDTLYNYGGSDVAMNRAGNGMAAMAWSAGLAVGVYATPYTASDTTPPEISIESPISGEEVTTSPVTVSGMTEPGVTLTVNGVLVSVGTDGTFSFSLALEVGWNTITATAVDEAGNSASDLVSVGFADPLDDVVEDLQDQLDAAYQNLSASEDELDDLSADLGEALEGLDDADGRLDSLSAQANVLTAALVGLAVLVVALAVMYARLKKGDGAGRGPSKGE